MTDRQSTHGHDCWDWGPKHYKCAVREIKALRAEAERLREALALLPDEHDMIEHNPDEGPRMACCWREVQVQFHGPVRTHDEDCWYARMRALLSAVERDAQAPHPDDAAVDCFAAAMKAKLKKKRQEGRGGWQSMTSEQLSALLHEHVRKGDPVDVANLAMMLHQNGQVIEPPTTVVADKLAEAEASDAPEVAL